jgi:polysaccharide chain length determinant protein (PEP-CTERM system associated)
MRKNINVQPSRRGDIFTITFSGGEPATVVKVTNDLAAKFIEENLKYREERATETSSYTSNELEMAKSTMDRKEAAMRDYKLKYYNEMPDQRQANLSRLTSLQEQYQAVQVSILELERTRVLVQEQIGLRKKALGVAGSGTTVSSVPARHPSYEQLQKMRRNLELLLVTHTESHPEVKRVKKIIEKLEAEGAGTPQQRVVSGRRAPVADNDLMQLQAQLDKIIIDIETIELEKKQMNENIKKYETWVAATPVREAEWSALTREYGQLKSHYDFLISQDLQAKSMLNLERRQKGSQFKIVDPARYPEKPTKPDFLKIMAVVVAGSMAAGVGVILAIDFLDGSFRDPEEAELFLGIPVLSTIEFIDTPAEKRRQLYLSGGVILMLLTGAVLVIGLFWYAWSRGKIVL